jgi:hypothetical protein
MSFKTPSLVSLKMLISLSPPAPKDTYLGSHIGRVSQYTTQHCFERDLREEDNEDGTPPWLSDEELRVLSEHTIGMLKGRFPFLKSISPMVIDNSKKSVKRILRIIHCCVILHNLLIYTGDEIPSDWIEIDDSDEDNDSDDECSDVGLEVGEYNMIDGVSKDNDDRRQRCMEYFINMVGLLES